MMANESGAKVRRSEFGTLMLLGLFVLSGALILCGCSSLRRYATPDKLPYQKIAAAYNNAQLKRSNTLDVLSTIRDPQYKVDAGAMAAQLLSQSDTMVAVAGQSKDLYKTWFSLFVFDERTMTAGRKYFFCIDEKARSPQGKPRRYLIPSKRALMFDSHLVLPGDLLAQPYATEEAKHIAILKHVAGTLKSDIQKLSGPKNELAQGNKLLSVSSMMMNQMLEDIVRQIQESPGLARQLGDKNGIPFNHINLSKGRVKMLSADDTVLVKIRVGLPIQ